MVDKTWKEMAKKPLAKSKAQKRKGSPAHPIIRLKYARTRLKNDSKRRGKMVVLEKPFFPPLLARCSKHWRGIFPKLNHYIEELVFFINHQTWKILQRKWSAVALTKNKKRWRKLVLHAAQWSTANYPAVYSKLNHKTICGGASCSKMTRKMRKWLKRSRNLPWPPKLIPAEIRNDERQAGHFLCPLVTVDFATE